MLIVGLFLGVLVGVATAAAAAAVVLRTVRREAAATAADAHEHTVAALAERAAAEQAGLSAELLAEMASERDRTVQTLVHQLAVEREQALHSTIEAVMAVAGDKLGSHTAAASQELGLRSESFDQKVTGMNDELRQVRQLVAQLQRDKAEQHGQIVQGINEAVRASSALADTTQSLREALSNSRARGQWGERMAEDVLRSAGFVEGVNYVSQQTLPGGSRPDLTFLLPRDRRLHMDVKFPIDNYLRHLDATTEAERQGTAKAFVRDVRARVKELTTRDYTDPDTTVGYVLLFIPNESVYGFIHEFDPRILDDALSQQVVLCSPFSLFAVLGVVRQAVDNFLVERTSDEILETLAGFTKQWEAFSDKLDRLGAQFSTAQKTYDELAGTRRRQLVKQLDHVDRLRSARRLDELSAARPSIDIGRRAGDDHDSELDDHGARYEPADDEPDDDYALPIAAGDHGSAAASAATSIPPGGAPHGGRRVARLRPLR